MSLTPIRVSPAESPGDEAPLAAARDLLRGNLTPAGILAATPSPLADARRYTRIFGRDAAICALGMALSNDPELIAGAWAGLETLARHQSSSGQIPKFVDPRGNEADFWYLGCIDATLWWLIALDFLTREQPAPGIAARLQDNAARALGWLRAQEHPGLGLVQQNEASDWADIFPRSGYVLYSNALWHQVKRRYGLPDHGHTRDSVRTLLRPDPSRPSGERRMRLLVHFAARARSPREALFLSYVGLGSRGEEGDVFGNLLAALFGLATPSEVGAILDALAAAGVDSPVPVRAVCRPITREDRAWRPFMARHRQNLPLQYHNGGAWPFIGGFWVIAQAAAGRMHAARIGYDRLVDACAVNDWQFNEWFHGASGVPMGMPRQSWNAALLLLARHALTRRIF